MKRLLFCTEASYLQTGFAVLAKNLLSRLHAAGKYDICEYASYARHGDQRWSQVPWKLISQMPDPNNQAEVDEYNSHVLNQFGAWRFEEALLGHLPETVCVPPGSLVLTSKGYQRIEKIAVGDLVMTHRGRWRPVLRTFKRQYEGSVRRIYVNGNAIALTLTGNHPVYALKKRRQTNQKKTFQKIYAGIDPEFIPAEELQPGDLVALPRPESCSGSATIAIEDHLVDFYKDHDGDRIRPAHRRSKYTLPSSIPLTFNLARLVGYFLGDGTVNRGGVKFFFSLHEHRFVQDVLLLMKQIFGVDGYAKRSTRSKMWIVFFNSVLLGQFFSSWVGAAKKKHVPFEFWSAPIDVAKGLIVGMVRSDGCYRRNTVTYTSVKKRLANEYRMLCLKVGIPVNIQYVCAKEENGHCERWRYDVDGYGQSAVALHECVTKHKEAIGTKNNGGRVCRTTQIMGDCLISSVRRVRDYQYRGQVYNLEVAEDNSYIVDTFCVHNCSMKDPWMMGGESESPFRPYYRHLMKPTVDSAPIQDHWLAMYEKADLCLAWSDWGKKIMEEESQGKIKVLSEAPAGVDYNVFRMRDRKAQKEKLGVDGNALIVGFLSRNQARKLFPDLAEAFARFLQTAPPELATRTYMYWHTSYPDIGWNLPQILRETGIGNKVLFTYQCLACGAAYPGFYQDVWTTCKNCGQPQARLPRSDSGVSEETLSEIYGLFDVYVQYSNAEGLGIGAIEAAGCGCPVMAVNYSAMEDVLKKVNGIPINVQRFFRDPGTHAWRALPDNDDFARKLIDFLLLPEGLRLKRGFEARQGAERWYNWDRCAKIWMDAIDSLDPIPDQLGWGSSPRIHQIPTSVPEGLSDHNFVRWGLVEVAGRPDLLNSYVELKFLRELYWHCTNVGFGGIYVSEQSMLGMQPRFEEFNRDKALKTFVQMGEKKNKWEMRRWERVKQLA